MVWGNNLVVLEGSLYTLGVHAGRIGDTAWDQSLGDIIYKGWFGVHLGLGG